MAKTETNVNNLKINRGTYAKISENIASIEENELIITEDKNLPVPTANDAGKVPTVNNSGDYKLQTPSGMSNPMTTAGDIIIGGANGAATRLAKGTAGQFLVMNDEATAPEWQTVPDANGVNF